MLRNNQGKDVTAEFDALLQKTHPKMREHVRNLYLPDYKEVLEPSKPHGKMFRLETRANVKGI